MSEQTPEPDVEHPLSDGGVDPADNEPPTEREKEGPLAAEDSEESGEDQV